MNVQNAEPGNIIREQAGLTLVEGYPQNLSNNIQAVMDMTPNFHKKIKPYSASSGVSGSITAYTAVIKRKLEIFGYYLALAKDASCDIATGNVSINFTQDGVSKVLVALPVITLTAQQMILSLSFDKPIVCDENTSVTVYGTYTAGVMRRQVTIYGNEVNA